MHQIISEQQGKYLNIAIKGSLNLNAFNDFHNAYPLKMQGIHYVTIDLADTTYMDSSGISMLISLWKLLNEDKSRLLIQNSNKELNELFDLFELNRLMQIQ